jgi:hypothetical protein
VLNSEFWARGLALIDRDIFSRAPQGHLGMPMADGKMVDLGQADLMGERIDALGVAVRIRIAGVDRSDSPVDTMRVDAPPSTSIQ